MTDKRRPTSSMDSRTDLPFVLRNSSLGEETLAILRRSQRTRHSLGSFNQREVYLDTAIPEACTLFAFFPGPPVPDQQPSAHDSQTTAAEPPEVQVQTHVLLGRVVAGSQDTPTSYIVSRSNSFEPDPTLSGSSLWIMADDMLLPVEARRRPDLRRGDVGIDGTSSWASRPVCGQLITHFHPSSPLQFTDPRMSYKIGAPGEACLEPELEEERYQELLSLILELEFKKGYSHAEATKFRPGCGTFVDQIEAERWHNRDQYGPKWRFPPHQLWKAIRKTTLATTTPDICKIQDGIMRGDEITPVFHIKGAEETMSICWITGRLGFRIPDVAVDAMDECEAPGTAVAIHDNKETRIVLPLGRLRSETGESHTRFFVVKDLTSAEYGLLASSALSDAEDDVNWDCEDEEVIQRQLNLLRTSKLVGQDKPFSYAILSGFDPCLEKEGTTTPTVELQVIMTEGYEVGPVRRKDGVLVAR